MNARLFNWWRRVILAGGGLLFSACSALTPEGMTLTPTWAYSAPTLAPSPTVDLSSPTPVPPGYVGPGQTDLNVADLPWNADVPPAVIDATDLGTVVVQMPLRDGVLVKGDLYAISAADFEQASIDPRLPGILLVGAESAAWGTLPERLRQSGFTVLTIAMGERQAAVDLVDVLRSFIQLDTVDPGSISVIGVGIGADQTLLGCAMDLLCDAAVLISPRAPETLLNVLPDYHPRPLLLVHAANEPVISFLDEWQQRATETTLIASSAEVSGIELLGVQEDLNGQIINWLVAQIFG